MQKQIIHIVEQKLTQALREVDARTETQVRAAWSAISPAPTCPWIGTVMTTIHESLVHGYRERGRIAKEVILSTLRPFRSKLTNRLVKETMAVVAEAFPGDTFLALAKNTPDVYKRKQAPPNKFAESDYLIEFACVSVTADDISRRTVENIQIALDEMLLHESIAHPVWWRRIPLVLWKLVAIPAVKWVFGIVAAVVIATFSYHFGIK